MKKEARANKVEVQRGPIEMQMPLGRQMYTLEEKAVRDAYDAYERRDGELLKFHTPKQ